MFCSSEMMSKTQTTMGYLGIAWDTMGYHRFPGSACKHCAGHVATLEALGEEWIAAAIELLPLLPWITKRG
jgi:hypothetical protein